MKRLMIITGLAVLGSLAAFAQSKDATDKQPIQIVDKAARNFYQLNFVVRELENEKVINSRAYSIMMRTDTDRGSVRAGEKIPFNSTGNQLLPVDVGVFIDCRRLEESGDRLSLAISADITSLVEAAQQAGSGAPIVRTNRWESTVSVPLKQPTILFSSDDPSSKRKMQLQLTATLFR